MSSSLRTVLFHAAVLYIRSSVIVDAAGQEFTDSTSKISKFRTLEDGSGGLLCVSDPPDQVQTVRSKIQCALVCQETPGCVLVNWLDKSSSCEIYFQEPMNYAMKDRCTALESYTDECASNPCQNGGICTDGIMKYTCTCIHGFMGTQCESNCPPGFIKLPGYNSSCYNLITTLSDWSTSGEKCRRLVNGSHAVAVETAEEDTAIVNYLNNIHQNGKFVNACLIEARQIYLKIFTSGQTLNPSDCNSSFYWKPYQVNNTPVNYTNFHQGQPSCLTTPNEPTATCLQYWFTYTFKWDDTQCYNELCVLCEYEL